MTPLDTVNFLVVGCRALGYEGVWSIEIACWVRGEVWMDYLDPIRKEIADEYAQPHIHPWIIGFSGGKDSTLVVHLVFEFLMSIPRSKRTRRVHIVANDTLVESPLVVAHVRQATTDIREAAEAFGLPMTVAITSPEPDKSFWVNLIGRGYPPPNGRFGGARIA